MSATSRTPIAIVLILLATLYALSVGRASEADHEHSDPPTASQDQPAPFETPEAIRLEHRHLHEQLAAAQQAGGRTAQAARKLEKTMAAHFAEEERYAMPPLGLLSRLAAGEQIAGAEQAIAMADHVRQNLARFRQEHEQITQALQTLAQAATEENKPEHAEFAHRLSLHAEHEEQVLYPATILIGRFLEQRQEQPDSSDAAAP